MHKHSSAIVCFGLAVGIAQVALAQSRFAAANKALEITDDGRFIAEWEPRPATERGKISYPLKALNKEMNGIAMLCCTPKLDRKMECKIGYESPEGYGFGEAAIKIAADSQMTTASYEAFKSDPQNWIQMPLYFRLGAYNQKLEDSFANIRDATRGLCKKVITS